MEREKPIKRVEHEGVIISITPDNIKVRIESRSACASCHAKGLCSASEMEQKEIDVAMKGGEQIFSLGERVIVELEEGLGLRAAWIVYAPPIIILVAILLYLQHIQVSELLIGITVFAGIGIYFLLLYLFRNKIGKKFYFTIRKTVEDN